MAARLCVLCVLCLTFSGCGYALSGRGSFLPEYIHTIGIPPFTNRTPIFNLETQITQKVRSEFIGRGRYHVVPEQTDVDAVLIGEVVGVSIVPVSF
ncbi:MAG: LPS assembly lipoprotein LptE, partial [Acidobacteriaceae bacterium]|nr:LPS assembly lipoprotein LptE [Acidobacteriaceae bacterium]